MKTANCQNKKDQKTTIFRLVHQSKIGMLTLAILFTSCNAKVYFSKLAFEELTKNNFQYSDRLVYKIHNRDTPYVNSLLKG